MKSLLNALKDGRLVELPDTDKERSLRFLAHLIEAVPELGGSLSLDEEVIAREKTCNTGIGLGVACPHVRAPGGGELLCAVGWSPLGIDYGSKDGKKVHLVVMYYIPESDKNTYLKEVSSLAGAVKKEGSIQLIAKAEDIATVREQLLDWVSAALDAGIPETKARMVRLEARQAAATVEAATPGTAAAGPLLVKPLLILEMAADRHIVLSHDAALGAALEKDPNLPAIIRQEGQFDQPPYRLIFQQKTNYDHDRILYEYLAVKRE
jgi:mannitol/fructose-specific phosphotransferase system IIA component (Ntr-type)